MEGSGWQSEGAGSGSTSAGKGGGVKGVQKGEDGGRWLRREDEADLAAQMRVETAEGGIGF